MGPQELTCGNQPPRQPRRLALTCFNGAAGINLRKFWFRGTSRPRASGASMGPQELTCGNESCDLRISWCLDASMGPQELTCGNLENSVEMYR